MKSINVPEINLPVAPDTKPPTDMTDLFLLYNRRALAIALLAVLLLGTTVVDLVFWPNSVAALWPAHMPWLFPVLVVFTVLALGRTLQGRHWDVNSPEVKAILHDEFRRANLARAQRGAFLAILLAQVPLAFLLVHQNVAQAVMGMAGFTITVGLAIFISLFLFFDRE